MKKTYILIILFCLTLRVDSQITNFWGIEFGSTTNEAERIMFTKDMNIHISVEDLILYKGDYVTPVYFAGHYIKQLGLHFYNGKFYSGGVELEDRDNYTLKSFKELEAQLTTKYGKPSEYYNDKDIGIYKRKWVDGKASISLERTLNTKTISLYYTYKVTKTPSKNKSHNDL